MPLSNGINLASAAVAASGHSSDSLSEYSPRLFFCELYSRFGNVPDIQQVLERLNEQDVASLRRRSRGADQELFNLGITFTVYTDRTAIDRILPFDVISRILTKEDWSIIERGVKQRVTVINLFLQDVYNSRHILKDGVVPEDLVFGNPSYRPEMEGFTPPHGTYANICGIDIVRDQHGDSWCWKIMPARRPVFPMLWKTAI